jgi:hypothetical protein
MFESTERKMYICSKEVTGSCRKLHNMELRNSYSSLIIIRINKSGRMRLAGHADRMGEMIHAYNFSWNTLKQEALKNICV